MFAFTSSTASCSRSFRGFPESLSSAVSGVARGYLNRPALSAACFVPDPFSDQPGMRLYRSGDLTSWSGEGRLSFLGRIDHQVKVRGFRIELGEIEARLTSHEQVADACVVVVSADGDSRLAAAVSPTGQRPTAADLKDFLLRELARAHGSERLGLRRQLADHGQRQDRPRGRAGVGL